MIVGKEARAKFKNAGWVERTPASEKESNGVIRALDRDIANIENGKIKSRKYTLSELDEKFF